MATAGPLPIGARATDGSAAWRSPWLWLSLLALSIWWLPLGWRLLHSPDEGRYAQIALDWFQNGEILVPRLNGVLYFEKPPLVYWATLIAYELFGVSEFSARFWPALSALLPMPLMFVVVDAWMGRRVAIASIAVLASSLWWVANGHFLNLDMSLSAFMTIAMLFGWHAQQRGIDERTRRWRLRGLWIALALAVMSKGIVALVVCGLALGVHAGLSRDASLLRRLAWGEGLLVLAAICAPWFVMMEWRQPGFLKFFFIHEHFQRFTSTVHHRTGPWYYFLPIVAVGALPWTTLLPSAVQRAMSVWRAGFAAERFLLVYAASVLGFFSLSGSKLPSYVLPMFPALAILLAQRLVELPARRIASHVLSSAALLGALLVVALAMRERLASSIAPEAIGPFAAWLIVGVAILALAALGVRRWARVLDALSATVILALGALLCAQVSLGAYQLIERHRSPAALLASVADRLDPAQPFYSVRLYDQTVPFYLKRNVVLVDYLDEFEPGLLREPQRHVPTLDAFDAVWRRTPGAAAIMAPDDYAALAGTGLPMTLITRDARRVIVRAP